MTMTFRCGNDESLETRTLAILPVGIAGVNGVLHVYEVPGGAPLLLSEDFLETSVVTSIWVAGTFSLRSRECEQRWKANTRRICFYP